MKCYRCGEEYPVEGRFCPGCGARIQKDVTRGGISEDTKSLTLGLAKILGTALGVSVLLNMRLLSGKENPEDTEELLDDAMRSFCGFDGEVRNSFRNAEKYAENVGNIVDDAMSAFSTHLESAIADFENTFRTAAEKYERVFSEFEKKQEETAEESSDDENDGAEIDIEFEDREEAEEDSVEDILEEAEETIDGIITDIEEAAEEAADDVKDIAEDIAEEAEEAAEEFAEDIAGEAEVEPELKPETEPVVEDEDDALFMSLFAEENAAVPEPMTEPREDDAAEEEPEKANVLFDLFAEPEAPEELEEPEELEAPEELEELEELEDPEAPSEIDIFTSPEESETFDLFAEPEVTEEPEAADIFAEPDEAEAFDFFSEPDIPQTEEIPVSFENSEIPVSIYETEAPEEIIPEVQETESVPYFENSVPAEASVDVTDYSEFDCEDEPDEIDIPIEF